MHPTDYDCGYREALRDVLLTIKSLTEDDTSTTEDFSQGVDQGLDFAYRAVEVILERHKNTPATT